MSVDLKVCKAGLAVPDCRDSRVNEGHKENRDRVDHKVRHVISVYRIMTFNFNKSIRLESMHRF